MSFLSRVPKPHPESLAFGGLLTMMIAIGQFSIGIYLPSMPSLADTFSTGPEMVNLTLSLFLFGFAISQLVYGPLSDRFGRRLTLLGGLALFVAASLACAAATTIEGLIAARILQSVGACSGPVLGRAIVRDVYGRERAAKVLAYIGLVFAISPVVVPVVGGYIHVGMGWQANFLVLAAVGVVLLVAAWLFLTETNRDPDPRALSPRGMVMSYVTLLGSATYLGYMLSVAFVFAGLMAYAAGSPFLFIDLIGLTPDEFGWMALFTVPGFLVGTLATARLSTRLGIDNMMLAGVSVSLLGALIMLAIALTGHLGIAGIVIPMLINFAGLGMVMPTGIAGALAHFPRMAGAASALLGFVQMALAAAASVAVGALPVVSQLPMAMVITGATAVAFLIFYILIWRRRESLPGSGDRADRAGGPPR